DQDAPKDQLDRVPEGPLDHRVDALVRARALAPVAVDEFDQPVLVLDDKGLVEAESGPFTLDGVRIPGGPQTGDGIERRPYEAEEEERRDQEDRYRVRHPTRDVREHLLVTLRLGQRPQGPA